MDLQNCLVRRFLTGKILCVFVSVFSEHYPTVNARSVEHYSCHDNDFPELLKVTHWQHVSCAHDITVSVKSFEMLKSCAWTSGIFSISHNTNTHFIP